CDAYTRVCGARRRTMATWYSRSDEAADIEKYRLASDGNSSLTMYCPSSRTIARRIGSTRRVAEPLPPESRGETSNGGIGLNTGTTTDNVSSSIWLLSALYSSGSGEPGDVGGWKRCRNASSQPGTCTSMRRRLCISSRITRQASGEPPASDGT